jgi:ribonuclease VapC
MIVDSSAIVSVLRNESDAKVFGSAILLAQRALMVAPTYLECCLVLTKDRSDSAIRELDNLIEKSSLELIPFTPKMARIAAQAFLKYGKGRGNSAQLNFGDCIAYAASKTEMMPLLFKGDDFRHTDVECAI